jgi:hypothetical protein
MTLPTVPAGTALLGLLAKDFAALAGAPDLPDPPGSNAVTMVVSVPERGGYAVPSGRLPPIGKR